MVEKEGTVVKSNMYLRHSVFKLNRKADWGFALSTGQSIAEVKKTPKRMFFHGNRSFSAQKNSIFQAVKINTCIVVHEIEERLHFFDRFLVIF